MRSIFLLLAVISISISESFAATYYWNRHAALANDKDFSKAYNWTSSADGTGTYPASSLDDAFGSNTIGTTWTYRETVGDGFSSGSISGGQLTLASRGADVWDVDNKYASVYRGDIRGNFFVSVKVVSQTNTHDYAKSGIMVCNDITNMADGGCYAVAVTPNHGVVYNYDSAGTQGQLDGASESGGSTSYPIWIGLARNGTSMTAWYRTSTGNSWSQLGTAKTPLSTKLKGDIVLYTASHNTGSTSTVVFDDFTGSGTIATAGHDLSFNGTGGNSDAVATLGSADVSVNSLDLTNYTGTLDFGAENGLFGTYYDNMDLTGTSVARADTMVSMDWGAATPAAGLGADQWSALWEGYVTPRFSEQYTFYCKSDDGCRLWVNDQLLVDKWVDQSATEWSGVTSGSLTAGTRYKITAAMFDNGGNAWSQVKWYSTSQPKEAIPRRYLNAGKLTVTGTGTCVNMPSGTITASNGTIDFAATSGTQSLVPRSSQNMPKILHSGSGTLRLLTNALSTIGFYQSAGTFDFNSLNLSTVASGANRGDFQVWNGGTSSFANISGRTISVAGHMSVTGSSGNLVNMNGTSNYNLNVTGRLTADYANIAYSTASITGGLSNKGTNGGNNSGWTFHDGTFYWNRNDIITASVNAQRTYNWTSNADATGFRPDAAENTRFPDLSLPSGWNWKDRDNDESVGGYEFSGGQLLLSTRGGDVYGGTNEYVTLYRTDLSVNNEYFDVTVKVMAQNNSSGWGKAGIIMANDFNTLSSGGYAYMAVTPGNNFAFLADVNAPTGEIDGGAGGGAVSFPCWIRLVRNGNNVSGWYRTSQSSAWTQSNATVVPGGISSSTPSQVGLFVCANNTGTTMSVVFDDFEAGGAFINSSDNTYSYAGTGGSADANSTLSGLLTGKSWDFTGYTGTFDHTGGEMGANTGNITFVSGMSYTGAGILSFSGSGAQTLTPKSGSTYGALNKSGAGALTIGTNAFTGGALTQSAGTIDFGTGFSHTLASIATSGSGTMTMGNNTFTINTGSADFSGLGTLNTSAGVGLAFSAASGTQVLTPKTGSTHPNVTHSGAGILQLAGSTLICRSFANSAGILDFNGQDITTNNSGNFSFTNGTTTTMSNLGGRTLTVAGTTSLAGQAGNLLNLNPSSTWYVNSTGALTANYVTLGNSTAGTSAGTPSNATNAGNNINWGFTTTDFSSWTYSTRIVINTTSTGAGVSSNLTSFPLLVRLDSNNFIFPQAKTDGSDIRFSDPDGTQLGYEIERFDYTLRQAEIWVNVPQIDGNSNDDYINMYWGKSSASAVSSGSGAFPTSNGFAAEWHLEENGNTSANGYQDATANAYHGTGTGFTASSDVAGMVGLGQTFDGSSTYMLMTGAYPTGVNARTTCAWAKANTAGVYILTAYGTRNSTNAIFGMVDWGAASYFGPWGDGAGDNTTPIRDDAGWHHHCGSYDGASFRYYIDGALQATEATTLATTSGNFEIGARPTDHSMKWPGIIDEVTVSTVARSADWIKMSYASQIRNGKVLAFANNTPSTWAYNSKVWINTSATGAATGTDLVNFPLLIRLTSANFDFSEAKSDGGDLRFTDSAGTLLPYELERFDAASKAAEVWVLVPTVYGNNASQWIRMYWGKPTATSMSMSAAVFSVGNRYLGVWHLDEDGNTTTGGYADATYKQVHGTGVNMANTDDAAAVIGNGQTLNGSSKYISIPAGSKEVQLAGKSYTLAIWAKRASTGSNHFLMGQGATAAADSALHFGFRSTNLLTIDHYADGVDARVANTSTSWQYLVATFDAANKAQKLYIDGVQNTSRTATAALAANHVGDFFIGRKKYGSDYWNGMIDEARVLDTSVTADWIKLNYETTKANATVVRLGPKPSDFSKSIQFNFNTTATGANIQGSDVANIPILIRLNSANFDFSATRDDGTDIQFVDKDGAYLYHESVGNWDKANKTANVWVRVPQVDRNSTADYITLYYGCAACVAQPYNVKDSVWSAYAGVYHLNAPENAAMDASKNNYHGTYTRAQPNITGMTSPLAPVFDGANDYITTATPSNVGTRTLDAWIYPRSSDDVSFMESVIDGDVGGQFGSGIGLDNGYLKVVLDNQFWTTNRAVTLNQWQHIGVRFNATTAVLFYNGAAVDSLTYTQGAISSATYLIGKSNANAQYFDGYINDVKIMDAYNSYDYLKLSYENQKANSTFLGTPVVATAASFQNSKVFRFNTTASGANVTGDVYDFPALIRVQGTAILDAVQSGAPDIRFLASDGVTWLPYSIERWDNATTDSAEIWVKVPRIRANSSADFITLYYQQAAGVTVPDGQCASCVFESSNYAAAWHLNNSLTDATANANTGTNTNSTNGEGVIAAGRTFSGADYVNFGNGNSLKNTLMTTVEAWMKTSMTSGAGSVSVLRHDGHYTALQYPAVSDNLRVTRWLPGTTGTTSATGFNAGFTDNVWHHYAVTYDGQGNTKVYRDGAVFYSASGAAGALTTGGSTGFVIGATEAGAEIWTGKLDEVRVSSVVRDVNYMKLSYMNQRRDANPLFNPSLADFKKTKKYVFNTTRTGANVMDSVTDFPLLVRVTDVNGGIVDLAQNNAPDIRFLDGDGKTWLNYQIERWDKTKDSGEVWVRVPKIDGNSDHDFITMYYEQATGVTVADGQCAGCVFGTDNGFMGAWHLNTSGTGARPNAVSGGNSATPNNYNNDEFTGGIIAGADSLDGTDDYLHLGTGYADLTGGITVSIWAYHVAQNSWARLFDLGNGAPSNNVVFASGATWSDHVLHGYNATTKFVDVWEPGQIATGVWAKYTGTIDATGYARLYKNGALIDSGAGSNTLVNISRTNNYIGKANWADPYLGGKVDEPTISSVARNANWVKLEYETQRRTGNLFWNNRSSPNNQATLTATTIGFGNISLAWGSTVSDSSNADSVGIWLRYASYPDSVRGTGNTKVVILPKSDSVYSYPATYQGTYWFGLAVRNTSGAWSPFTEASTDTATLAGSTTYPDTVYVDSAIGSDANSCIAARNPATPKLKFSSAVTCGATAVDTLVIRYLPGTYTDSVFDDYNNTRTALITSFDNNSRAVFNGSGSGTHDGSTRNFTALMYGNCGIRNLDIKCKTNNNSGVYLTTGGGENNIFVEGCRIFNDGNLKHDKGIEALGGADYRHIAGNLIYQPTTYGIYFTGDNSYNFVNNTLVGTGVGGTKAIYVGTAAWAADANILNNAIYNWDYGIQTTSANIGTCAGNLLYTVTTANQITTTTCTGTVTKDPLFANTVLGSPHAFKLLPGSPAIDAGTSTYTTGGQSVSKRTLNDIFGTARPVGSAQDIGMYEGTGYTANPTSEFDSLIASSTATTVTVYNAKWKVVFDKAKGGGISEFYDQTAPSTNLLASGTILFDNTVTATSTAAASSQSTIAPTLVYSTRSRVVVKQRFAHSASLDVNYYYTLYPSGHIFIQAEFLNLSAGNLTVGNDTYTVKVGTAVAAYNSNQENGYGYVTTSTRDVAFGALTYLDSGATSSETWTGSSATGASGYTQFATTDVINPGQYFRRYHHFLLYIGDTGLDQAKAAALHADASNPSALSASSGSLLHERSWESSLIGHWTFDEGAGSAARDKSIVNANNGTITGAKFASGKINSALVFTTSDVVNVADNDALEAGYNRTYMFWVKPDFGASGANARFLAKGTNNSDGWSFRRSGSAVVFRMGGNTATSWNIADGAWTHVAAVVEVADRIPRIYINGVLSDVSSGTPTPAANDSALRIGENSAAVAASRFAGSIDDCRIYNTAVPIGDLQAIVNRGFNTRYGQYQLRADNNNRLVVLMNESGAAARVQPAFQIDNWYGPAEPKYVYLNGVRLAPKTDYLSSLVSAYHFEGASAGNHLLLQLNRKITGASQTLFVDDDDSTGYLGTASAMKSLAIATTANDKITVKNFADTVFGGQSAGQWSMDFDLNGWSPTPSAHVTDTGFGSVNVFKSSWASPNVAVSAATSTVGQHNLAGKCLVHMKLDNTGTAMWDAGAGYTSPANLTFTMNDSSSTRLSMTSSTITTTGEGTATLTKRWTVYPTGRIFGSMTIATSGIDLDQPVMLINLPYQASTQGAWGATYALNNARYALIAINPGFTNMGAAILSVKSFATATTVPGTMLSSIAGNNGTSGGDSFKRMEFWFQPGLFQTGDVPITVNFMLDFSKNFTDSATADSLLKDSQTPGVITAITGTRITSDGLDLNTDNFAEGDGAYTYQASGGIAHFRFVNTVTTYNPAMRISSWTYGTLPEVVVVDNQVLTRGYHYNAFLNTASNEVVIQFNRSYAPGTHVFFISHKTGLAVTLSAFAAKGGEGVDTLTWATESEFENLGYHIWRRIAPGSAQVDTGLAAASQIAGAGIANALAQAAKSELAKNAAAKLAKASGDTADDTLESMRLAPHELEALGYVRITPKIIPGSPGGSSAATRNYRYIDRSAAFGVAYEYLLEAVDFHNDKEQFGPRTARPSNPLATELLPNYPNPFNPVTTLRFSLKEKLKVSLVIYDGKGRVVRTLVRPDRPMAAGKYRLVWDARNEGGFEVPSGQYFYRFMAGRYVKTRKMILVK